MNVSVNSISPQVLLEMPMLSVGLQLGMITLCGENSQVDGLETERATGREKVKILSES